MLGSKYGSLMHADLIGGGGNDLQYL